MIATILISNAIKIVFQAWRRALIQPFSKDKPHFNAADYLLYGRITFYNAHQRAAFL